MTEGPDRSSRANSEYITPLSPRCKSARKSRRSMSRGFWSGISNNGAEMDDHLFVCPVIFAAKKICQQADMLPIFLVIIICFKFKLQSKQKLSTYQQKSIKKSHTVVGRMRLYLYKDHTKGQTFVLHFQFNLVWLFSSLGVVHSGAVPLCT